MDENNKYLILKNAAEEVIEESKEIIGAPTRYNKILKECLDYTFSITEPELKVAVLKTVINHIIEKEKSMYMAYFQDQLERAVLRTEG